MKTSNVLFLVFLITITLCVVDTRPAKAEPKTIVVPDDYPTIGAAIGNASLGDTIFVKKGVYYEHLQINKSLLLIGEDKEATIIDGGKVGACVIINQNLVNMSGFMIRNSGEWRAGIELRSVKGCNISGNIVTACSYGISLYGSFYNIIAANKIRSNSGSGIRFEGYGYEPNFNSILRNEISSNEVGIDFFQGWNNTIYGNNITNNRVSIELRDSSYNTFVGNNITGYTITMWFTYAPNNIFHHNNFIGKIVFVDLGWLYPPWIPNSSICIWNSGREGNYWSSYNGTDNNQDGIGDTPYIINEKNQDSYPLMNPISAPPPLEIKPLPDIRSPIISVISPENKTYAVNDVYLTFTVSEPTSWVGYSLDGQTNVTIYGNITLTGLPDGKHNLIVYAMDTAGNTGSSETIYFSIKTQRSEPFPLLWVAAATATIGAALVFYFAKIKKAPMKAKQPKNFTDNKHVLSILI